MRERLIHARGSARRVVRTENQGHVRLGGEFENTWHEFLSATSNRARGSDGSGARWFTILPGPCSRCRRGFLVTRRGGSSCRRFGACGAWTSRATFEVKPGKMQLRVSVEGSASQVLDSEIREITVPDLTAPNVSYRDAGAVPGSNDERFPANQSRSGRRSGGRARVQPDRASAHSGECLRAG